MISTHCHILPEVKWGWNGSGHVWDQAKGSERGIHTVWAHGSSYRSRAELLRATQRGCSPGNAPLCLLVHRPDRNVQGLTVSHHRILWCPAQAKGGGGGVKCVEPLLRLWKLLPNMNTYMKKILIEVFLS